MKTIIFIFLNFIAVSSYAALNIPMPGTPSDSFLNGLNTGSNFSNNIITAQQALHSINIQRQEEAMPQLQMEIMREQLRQLKKNRH
jgi:hypothetical protein